MNVSFRFDLRQGDFQLRAQGRTRTAVTGVFGPSGCGKTTLLHLLAGLRKADAGFLEVDGVRLFDAAAGLHVPPHKRRVAVVFQESRLFPHLSVTDNLRYGERGLAPEARRFRFEDVVSWLALGPLLDKSVRMLSGGEGRLVALGRALLSSPRLLVLDEPLTGLDRGHTRRILDRLRRIQEQTGIPMIYVSHDLGELLQLTDHLLVMRDGEVVGHDSFFDLVTRPEVLNLIHDLGLLNVFKMEVVSGDPGMGVTRLRPLDDLAARVLWSGPPAAPGAVTVFVGLRPEDIGLVTRPVEHTSIQNQVWGKVGRVISAGHRVLVVVESNVRLLAEITPQSAHALDLQPGRDIYCLFKAQALRYL